MPSRALPASYRAYVVYLTTPRDPNGVPVMKRTRCARNASRRSTPPMKRAVHSELRCMTENELDDNGGGKMDIGAEMDKITEVSIFPWW